MKISSQKKILFGNSFSEKMISFPLFIDVLLKKFSGVWILFGK